MHAVHCASWIMRVMGSSAGTGNQVRKGGESTRNACEESREWTVGDLVMKRAEKTRQVLKGLEYMYLQWVFTMLALSYSL